MEQKIDRIMQMTDNYPERYGKVLIGIYYLPPITENWRLKQNYYHCKKFGKLMQNIRSAHCLQREENNCLMKLHLQSFCVFSEIKSLNLRKAMKRLL